jgi:chemotaxis signal transduction protein
MRHVTENRETLKSLESVWDVLNLLGQLSGTTTEMGGTKAAFAALSTSLLDSLAHTTLDKRVQELCAPAQVAIDILVRNLFERTADIGFLAIDDALRDFAASAHRSEAERAAMAARLQAYVARYSVYRDVILVAPSGAVLARLPGQPEVAQIHDPLLAQVLASDAPYTEAAVRSDLFPAESRNLFYAVRVQSAEGAVLGALFLCFDFEYEVKRIFASLQRRGDWSVITLLDDGGMVIASSDTSQVAPGAVVDVAPGDGQLMRFAGRRYLASRRAAQGFQGYMGPGWSALVLVPLDSAFEDDEDDDDEAAANGEGAELLRAVLADGSAFPPELQRIPPQAEAIQRELSRSVWNANIRQGQTRQAALNPAFSRVLLAEIVRTGTRMKEVFTRSIGKLQTMAVAAHLDDCRFHAALAIDMLDRNLYERSNDCRWWALDPLLCAMLQQPDQQDAMSARLRAINELYTVYDSLLLFDAHGVVVAASRPHAAEWIGRRLDAPWQQQALALRDAERYVVSEFVADDLYAGRPTWVYATSMHGADGRHAGGIAVVFDSAPQLAAMLEAARPPKVAGACALFVDAAGQVIASTDARWTAGAAIALPPDLLAETIASPAGAARLVVLDGQVMAVGARASTGYREYKGSAGAAGQVAIALICVPLGAYTDSAVDAPRQPALAMSAAQPAAAGDSEQLEIASFHVGNYLLGVPASAVIEALPFGGCVQLPNASPAICGATIYQGNTMLIYDLQQALGVTGGGRRENMLTVVLADANGKRFGVLVERLGEIPVVPLADIAPVNHVFVGITPVLASIVKSADAEGQMLTLLAVEHMAAVLRDAPAVEQALLAQS